MLNGTMNLRDKYMDLRPSYKSLPVFKDTNIVSIELISKMLSSMKNGRAAGLDQLTSEHIKYCHPIVASILCKLFNCFIATQHIPVSFGASYIVPINAMVAKSLFSLMTSEEYL